MPLTIRLYPPYRKKGSTGQFKIKTGKLAMRLKELASLLEQEFKEQFAYPLFDGGGRLTAEFIVNGRHQPLDYLLARRDTIYVIPYLCGG